MTVLFTNVEKAAADKQANEIIQQTTKSRSNESSGQHA